MTAVDSGARNGQPGSRRPLRSTRRCTGRRSCSIARRHDLTPHFPVRSRARRSRSRTTLSRLDHPTTCGSRILEGYVSPYEANGGAPTARGRRHGGGEGQPRRVRDGIVDRAFRVRPGAASARSRACAWRVEWRLGGPGRRERHDHAHSARKPAVRCANPRRSAAWSASSRVMDGYRASGWSRSARRSTAFRPLAAPPAPRRQLLCAISGRRPARRHDARGAAARHAGSPRRSARAWSIGLPREYFPSDLHPGVRAGCDRAIAALEATGRRGARRVAAAHAIRRSHLLHRESGRSCCQPRPLRRRSLRSPARRTGW